MRLIDADELKKTVGKYEFNSADKRIKHGGDIVLNLYIPKVVDDTPTIEAEPVRHGKWEFAGDGIVGCTSCGETYPSRYVIPRNYCPNCGAKMDRGERNEENI